VPHDRVASVVTSGQLAGVSEREAEVLAALAIA